MKRILAVVVMGLCIFCMTADAQVTSLDGRLIGYPIAEGPTGISGVGVRVNGIQDAEDISGETGLFRVAMPDD